MIMTITTKPMEDRVEDSEFIQNLCANKFVALGSLDVKRQRRIDRAMAWQEEQREKERKEVERKKVSFFHLLLVVKIQPKLNNFFVASLRPPCSTP
jgi:hypothetical protein